MTQQTVRGPKLEGGKGFLAILGMAVGVYVLALIMQTAADRTGMSALPLITWALTIVLVVYLIRAYICEYRFTLSDGSLILERLTGSTHGRVIYALAVTQLLGVYGEEEAKAKFGQDIRIENLVLPKSPLPQRILAFKKDGSTHYVRLQMEEAFEQSIRDSITACEK